MFIIKTEKATRNKNLLVILSKDNKKVVPIFKDKDDADRLTYLLEAEGTYPKMEVIQTNVRLIENLEIYSQPYVMIKENDLEYPNASRKYAFIG